MNTRVFFATDIHGSEKCFRKFVKAGTFYKANVIILGGDLTGKMLVPMIKQADGKYECWFLGKKSVTDTPEKEEALSKVILDSGCYPIKVTATEMEELRNNPESMTVTFSRLMRERLQAWMILAEERLKGTGIRMCVTGGNDDPYEVDKILKGSATDYVTDPEDEVFWIDGHHEMISSGLANTTPWKCPRDVDEQVLTERIEAMISKVKNIGNCIFNLHPPPYDSLLDTAPQLNDELRPVISGGTTKMIPVGSLSVRRAIEKYQPLIGLHGHIHESRGFYKLGRTLCLNPGSEYSEGVLRGVIINLDEKGIKDYLLTSG